jgi:hypothetical protein
VSATKSLFIDLKKVSSIRFYSLLLIVCLLGACSGNQALESRFSADPKLETNTNQNSSNNIDNKIPPNFPQDIPIYPQAKLITTDGNKTIWSSADPFNLITNFYQQDLTGKKWTISQQEDNLLIATNPNNNQTLKLSLIPNSNQTEFSLEYQAITPPSPPPTNTEKPVENQNKENQPVTINNSEQINPELSTYIQDLVKLGIISSEGQTLEPHKLVTRREYASWLVKANNTFYANSEGSKIRLASPNSTPIFSDISQNDPDFGVIQGLAEAGLIPSGLTQNASAVNFRPEDPLTRQDLIAWKVPLDFRKGLPSVTLDTIKETWGFQDVANIDPLVWRFLYVDWQNGDKSNVKRALGYTLIFQPKKQVTLAEVAAVLWYFGYQTEGKSAQELIKN